MLRYLLAGIVQWDLEGESAQRTFLSEGIIFWLEYVPSRLLPAAFLRHARQKIGTTFQEHGACTHAPAAAPEREMHIAPRPWMLACPGTLPAQVGPEISQ